MTWSNVVLTLVEDNCGVGGDQFCGSELVREYSAMIGTVHLPLFYFPEREKWEMSIVRVVPKN